METLSNLSSIQKVRKFFNETCHPLIPHLCIGCENPALAHSAPALCEKCTAVFWEKPRCPRCNRACHQSELKKARCSHCKNIRYAFKNFKSLGSYQLWLKEAILSYKFKQDRLALLYLQSVLSEFDLKELDEDSVITFISSHPKRLAERGVKEQHLKVLLKPLEKLTGRPIVETLVKTQSTQAQITLSGKERRNAVIGTLEWCYEGPLPQKVYLFDDVWTTGSTMKEAARIIKEAGVNEVFCRAFAAIDYH